MIIKNYLQFIKESSGYEYGCVMIEVPVINWNELTNSIDLKDVYTGGDDSHGIQEFPHLTLIYGLKKDVTEEQIKSILDNFNGELHIEIDSINLFENEQFDVLKFNIVPDPGLQELHDKLSKLPNTDKFPTYQPHITIAYLNKGMGKKYVNPNYKYSVKNINKIVYSSPGKEKVYFEITDDRSSIMQTIEDIIIDFKEKGFKSLLGQDPGVPSIFKSDNKDDRRIILDVNKINNDSFKLSEIEDEILHIVSYVRSLNWGISATVSISSYGNPSVFHGDKKDFAYISSHKDGNFLDENGKIIGDVINVNIKVIPK